MPWEELVSLTSGEIGKRRGLGRTRLWVRDAVALVHLDRGKVWWRLGWLVDREVLV